jgi:hypothetical protein
MRRLAAGAMALGVFAASGANADAEMFTLEGLFNEGAFFGTMDLDLSTDTVTSIDIAVTGFPDFTEAGAGPPAIMFLDDADTAILSLFDNIGDFLDLEFTIPNRNTLAGFDGGEIFAGELTPARPAVSIPFGFGGIIAPASTLAPMPEPTTWSMMLVGLAGLGLAAKRRRAMGSLAAKA